MGDMTVRRVVGTAEECDLRIHDAPYLSSRHFAITQHDDGLVTVEDVGSTNGTSVYVPRLGWRDARYSAVPISAGSKIHAGQVLFKIGADGHVDVQRDVSMLQRDSA